MKELEPTFESTESVRGDHVEVNIVNPNKLRAYLEKDTAHGRLVSDCNTLVAPIKSSNIYFRRDDARDMFNITAEIAFSPDYSSESTLLWENRLLMTIDDMYGAETASPVHDRRSLYIPIGHHFFARISVRTELDECQVKTELIPYDAYRTAVGTEIDEEDEFPPYDSYTVLREVATMWTHIQDVIVRSFGPMSDFDVVGQHTLQFTLKTPEPEAQETDSSHDESIGITFDQIGGLTQAKERLMSIASIYKDREGAKQYGLSPVPFMLFGPPGTGKTTLVHALGNELGLEVKIISSSDIIDKWVGSSAQNIKSLFDEAKESDEPGIIFFDEFDALGGTASNLSSSERVDVIKILNTEITDMVKYYPHIIIAAATNVKPDDIEQSLIRSGRFEPIYTSVPDGKDHIDVWAAVLSNAISKTIGDLKLDINDEGVIRMTGFELYSNDIDITELSQRTKGMTGADFESIVQKACWIAYNSWKTTGRQIPVSQVILLKAIEDMKPQQPG